MEMMQPPEEIPSTANDDDIEAVAREIVEAARDVQDSPGKRSIVAVYFRSSARAQKVADCINERYGGLYHWKIEINLYH